MRSAFAFAGAPILGLVAVELVMQPTMGSRLQLGVFFVVTAAAVAAGARWSSHWARQVAHLGRAVVLLAATSVLGVGAAITAASGLMFIDRHDLQLLWIVLGFALVLGIVFAVTVSRPLTDDLGRIAATARRVGRGDLEARTGVRRRDEVGVVAEALDDMSGQLAAVEQERRREREARRAFLAAVGHDLRTPLAALRAALEALQDGVVDDVDRYLGSMERDVEALTLLVDDLFVLTEIESGHLSLDRLLIDLADLADDALESLRPVAAARGVELALSTPGHVPVVGGPEALARVIRNLVDNAIRHSPDEGRVLVRLESNGSAVLRVIDDGPGFRPGFVEHAFESFSRDDDARTRSGGGAGLGLAIARGFVEAHGGTIWADPGPGGRVAFQIPSTAQGA